MQQGIKLLDRGDTSNQQQGDATTTKRPQATKRTNNKQHGVTT